jgi:hypothetical protein
LEKSRILQREIVRVGLYKRLIRGTVWIENEGILVS